jgi:hypothetical protein
MESVFYKNIFIEDVFEKKVVKMRIFLQNSHFYNFLNFLNF